ncbi:polyprenyl synthetase family protein [Candidatus Gracilibacteria bacterium]|nr:polyprenyl synthetase family protein [Candidatus Gracilibacteria bacterium]
MNTQALPSWYGEYKDLIEKSITRYFDTYLAIPTSKPLELFKETVRYSCKGGKKLRAIFALEFYLTLSGKDISEIKGDDDILRLCIALEIIHGFSLVHDDLPCMDNDTLRRGEPTTWKKYGEYQAVLAGDMLNTLGFEIISDIHDPKVSQELAKLISHAIGFYGMVGGQIEDMYFEENVLELDENVLKNLHYKKTGRLIEASILGGIILSGQRSNIDVYKDFGRKIGLAFQIKDDLLDVEGTAEETGKSVGGEEKGFVYLSGVEKTRSVLNEIISDCRKISTSLGSEKIDFLVDYMEKRTK